MDVINLEQKLGLIDDRWLPRVVAEMNDYQVKLVKVQGEFVWHQHDTTDELFLVLQGELMIKLAAGDVRLKAGDLYVVPRGVQHMPVAEEEVHLLLLEPKGVLNTGDKAGDRTAPADVWI